MKRTCLELNTSKHKQNHERLALQSPSGFIRPMLIDSVRMKIRICLFIGMFLGASVSLKSQNPSGFPSVDEKYGVQQLIDDDKPWMMLAGELHNSSPPFKWRRA
jgi:hypothetical protein